MNDTIFALSSGQPPAGIGVVRVSGPGAGLAIERLTGRGLPDPRRAVMRRLRDPDQTDLILDEALLLWFPGPANATGEDLAEFHLHGGQAVVRAVIGALGRLPGLRGAEAGEFTRRAFSNGRIDLVEAEALSDLLCAETEAQRRNAMLMAGGALSQAIARWTGELLGLSARIEAVLDFSDEDDVALDEAPFRAPLAAIHAELIEWLARPPVERLRDGVRVVLAGPPNAGKSTLLNALAGREAAITAPIAGTTRDLIEVPVSIGGTAFVLTDTAGLRDRSDDAIERIGIDRAAAAMAAADLVLWLGQPEAAPVGDHVVRLHAQSDRHSVALPGTDLAVSAKTGEGMAALVALLRDRAGMLVPREGEAALNERQRALLGEAAGSLALGIGTSDLILIAESLRLARGAFDRLTGRAGTEDMLDALFGAFCIGK